MSLLMQAVGISSVTKMFQQAMPGPIQPWHTSTNTEYAAYVEYGTRFARAQPYMRPAIEQTESEMDELLAKAKSLNDYIRLIAMRLERNAKKKVPVDTGNLKRSIAAEKL